MICLAAVVLTYFSISDEALIRSCEASSPTESSQTDFVALIWFVFITCASFFINRMIVSFTSWGFPQDRHTIPNGLLLTSLYAWWSSSWPLAPAWLMSISTLLLICYTYVGANPPVSPSPSPIGRLIPCFLADMCTNRASRALRQTISSDPRLVSF